MIVEINYITVALLATVVGAMLTGLWAVGRWFLGQYGQMHQAHMTAHREQTNTLIASVTARMDALEVDAEERLKDHDRRLANLDELTARTLTRTDLGDLYERHNETSRTVSTLSERLGLLHGDLQELAGGFKGVQRGLDLIHQHLLDRSGK